MKVFENLEFDFERRLCRGAFTAALKMYFYLFLLTKLRKRIILNKINNRFMD